MNNSYFNKMHRFGAIANIIGILIIFAVPFYISMRFGIMPTLREMILASGGILLIFTPLGVAEVIAETPIMGTSYYLGCITGNILNLKLPATFNALKVSNLRQGTEEADAVVGVAVVVSSFVTLIILAVGLILIVPIKPALESEIVSTATKYVLPALFGYMGIATFSRNVGGGVKIYGRSLALILPTIICIVLFFFIMPKQYGLYQGVIALVLIPIIYISNKILYKKGKIKISIPSQK